MRYAIQKGKKNVEDDKTNESRKRPTATPNINFRPRIQITRNNFWTSVIG
jgi:hypothetical protein